MSGFLLRRLAAAVQAVASPPTRIATNGIQYSFESAAFTGSVGQLCNYPSGSASGDLLICFVHTQASAAGTYTNNMTSQGWNLITQFDDTSAQAVLKSTYWKFRGAEVSVTPTFSAATISYCIIGIVAYAGSTVHSTRPISASAVSTLTDSTANSTAAVTFPTVTTTTVNNALLYFGSGVIYGSNPTSVTWTGPAETFDVSGGYGPDEFTVAESTQASIGVTPAASFTPVDPIVQRDAFVTAVQPQNRIPVYKGVSAAQLTAVGVTTTVTYPAGSVSGDFLLLSIQVGNTTAGSVAVTTPAGWTLDSSGVEGANGFQVSTFWRFRGAETSVAITQGSAFSTAVCVAYAGSTVNATTPIHARGTANYSVTATTTAAPIPAVTTTVAECAIVGFWHGKRSSLTTVSTVTFAAGLTKVSDSGGAGQGTSITKALAYSEQQAAGTFAANTVTASAATNRAYGKSFAIQPP